MSIIISDTEPRVQYTATAGQTSFTVGFEFFDNADLKVFNGTSLLTFSASPADATEYSVSGAGQTGGGSITLGSPGATINDIITISRDLAIARSTDFPTSGAFQIASLNTELDKIIAMCQQLERDLKFSPKAAATTANTFDITFPNLAANKVLSVNSSGNGLEFSQDITDISDLAAITSDISAVSAIAADVTLVANDATDIGVVSTNIASINTVATNINDVIKVADDLNEAISEVETVANDLNEATSEIEVVANAIANVDIVGNAIANVNTLAGKNTELGLLGTSAVITDLDILGTTAVVTDLDILATSDNVTKMGVLGTSANVTAMGLLGNSSVVSNMGTLGTSTNVSNMSTLAGISNLTNLADAHASVTTVATNLASVNNFADVYRISATAPTTSLDDGDMWFDTTADKLKIWNGSSFDLAGSSINGTSARFKYVATASQTTFTGVDANGNTLAYDTGYIDAYLNGVHLDPSDYTATDGSNFVLSSGATVSDELYIVAFGTFSVSDFDASGLTGTINIARLADDSITNAKLDNSSITINGSAVSLGGSVTIGETKPTVSSISPTTITNAQATITITGANFTSIPQVEFLNPSTGIWYNPTSVTFNNSTSLTVVVTLAVDAQYKIRIENGDGNAVLTGLLLTVSDAPTWSTGASLGSFAGNFSGTLATLSATSDSTIAYSETTSVLSGAGITLNTSTGALTTTDFGASSTSPTTYTFTIRATDAESQTADRTFTISSTFGATGGGQFN